MGEAAQGYPPAPAFLSGCVFDFPFSTQVFHFFKSVGSLGMLPFFLLVKWLFTSLECLSYGIQTFLTAWCNLMSFLCFVFLISQELGIDSGGCPGFGFLVSARLFSSGGVHFHKETHTYTLCAIIHLVTNSHSGCLPLHFPLAPILGSSPF